MTLNYGSKDSALFIDDKWVAEGSGVQSVSPAASVLSIGRDLTGVDAAGGEFDEVCAFARPLNGIAVGFCYQLYAPTAARGAISPEEDTAMKAAAAKWKAERDTAGGGQQYRMMQHLPVHQSTRCFGLLLCGHDPGHRRRWPYRPGADLPYPLASTHGSCPECPGPIYWDVNFQFQVVPEPSVWWLLLPAGVCLFLRHRRFARTGQRALKTSQLGADQNQPP